MSSNLEKLVDFFFLESPVDFQNLNGTSCKYMFFRNWFLITIIKLLYINKTVFKCNQTKNYVIKLISFVDQVRTCSITTRFLKKSFNTFHILTKPLKIVIFTFLHDAILKIWFISNINRDLSFIFNVFFFGHTFRFKNFREN